MKNSKQITVDRLNRVIAAVILSPNKSAQRAALWVKLHNMRKQLMLAN
jgi:hypothetical protein